VAGFDLKLVPDDAIPKKQTGDSSLTVSIPDKLVPKFTRPVYLRAEDFGFWSNLKQFLFEKPIKFRGEARSPLMPSEYGGGFWANLGEFFSSKPVPKGSTPKGQLSNRWGTNFGGFGDRVKEFFFPAKQAPLPFEIKPVKVKDIWSKDENFGWTQIISIGVHAGVIALMILPFLWHFTDTTKAVEKVNVTQIDISDYVSKLPAGANKAGGGGGANDHTLTPVNKGKLPKFKMTQFTAAAGEAGKSGSETGDGSFAARAAGFENC